MTDTGTITRNIREILKELPSGVILVAAAKTRTAEEITAALNAGVKIIGENYVQEALDVYPYVSGEAKWHFIGHLQKNKVRKAVEIFDMIETLDSEDMAAEIDKRAGSAGKVMEVLVEVNSGRERQKNGVLPENVAAFVRSVAVFPKVRVRGVMTMGPFTGDPEDARPYFSETRKVFEELKDAGIPGTDIKYLSMGMTNSYKVAVEEGANIVRIGTKIFGER
jgi:hypothetical protein